MFEYLTIVIILIPCAIIFFYPEKLFHEDTDEDDYDYDSL